MLLFRDEEHVDTWCGQWQMRRGALLSLEQAWRLAHAWFKTDRGAPEWRRPSAAQVEELFGALNLTGEFWNLRQ